MACVRIATGNRAIDSGLTLIERLHSTLSSAFQMPESDCDVVLDIYDERRRIVSAVRSEPRARIDIVGIAAGSKDRRRALSKAIAENLDLVGICGDGTHILLIESPDKSWGNKRGLPSSSGSPRLQD